MKGSGEEDKQATKEITSLHQKENEATENKTIFEKKTTQHKIIEDKKCVWFCLCLCLYLFVSLSVVFWMTARVRASVSVCVCARER